MGSIQGVLKIYGMLLSLYPRDFQNEFKQEMEGVFAANLEEAAKTGATLILRACFFELLDLPVNLVVEHLSSLRKGNVMKNISFEVGRSRVVLMAALGMMVGWILINLEGRQYMQIIDRILPSWAILALYMVVYSLPVILCGLMLGIAAGARGSAFLRIGLWTFAGGMLGHLVTLPIRMVNTGILARVATLPRRESDLVGILALLAVMCTYGFFYGAGLGFAFGGWKAWFKFAFIGLVANAVGILAGYSISSTLSSRVQLGNDLPSYITWTIMGVLAGGILGWFFGKQKQSKTNPVVRTGNA